MRHILISLAMIVVVAWSATSAQAVKVADITRIGGARTNVLTGLGLVVGLKGTGDGGDFQPAIRPLAAMLAKFKDQANVRELANAQNVAIVLVTATVPASGVKEGDRIDAYITSIGAATSLKGGRLFVTPMQGPIPGDHIFGLTEGAIEIEDAAQPLAAVVRGGVVMEEAIEPKVIDDNGQFTLVLDEPSADWTNASTIAKIINDAEGDGAETLAIARDKKTIEVTIPANERQRPDSFISRVQRLPVPMLPTEARVVIDKKKASITLTGDVEISPVVISYKGLTISTTNPPPKPTERTPLVTEKSFVKIDPANTAGPKLQELVDALDMLKVPPEDRIGIIEQLHRSGKLHAKLIYEGQ